MNQYAHFEPINPKGYVPGVCVYHAQDIDDQFPRSTITGCRHPAIGYTMFLYTCDPPISEESYKNREI